MCSPRHICWPCVLVKYFRGIRYDWLVWKYYRSSDKMTIVLSVLPVAIGLGWSPLRHDSTRD